MYSFLVKNLDLDSNLYSYMRIYKMPKHKY
jgi:hypothetical protein